MNKENERITYKEFIDMFKFAPRMCYTLYEKAEDEIENLQKKAELGEHYKHLYSEVKKQKDDVVECCNKSIKSINEKLANNKEPFEVIDGKIIYLNDYQVVRLKAIKMKCKEILRMLGEIDD